MVKVLVVEDEFYARKSILKILRECGLDVEVCGEASNGVEAVGILEEKKEMDLVITDIKMDEMDGLELAKYVRTHFETTDILILTAFENFEFARQAIQYQVSDYLVKPITKENLIPAVARVLEKRGKQQKEQEERKRKLSREIEKMYFPVKSLLTRHELLEEFFSYEMTHPEMKYRMAVMQFEQALNDELAVELRDTIRERYGTVIRDVFFSRMNREFLLLVEQDQKTEDWMKEPKRVMRAMQNYMQSCKKFSVSIGVSRIYQGEEKLYLSYSEAVYALNQRLISGWGPLFYFDEMTEAEVHMDAEEEKLKMALQKGDEKEGKEQIHQMLHSLAEKEESAQKLYLTVVEILKILRNYYTEMCRKKEGENLGEMKIIFTRRADLYRFKHLEELEQYLFEITERLCRREEASQTRNTIVGEILEYIDQNYYQNISLKELAENKYFVNYSYLSRIFGQETGMTFSRYLISLRLKKAAEFLENEDMKINSIAFEVGYNDVSHFIQSFKKAYGMTPEEFRSVKKMGG